MDQNETQLQPIGICHKLFYFIMRTLAAQALKPVTLGPPVPREQTRKPGIERCPITHYSESRGSPKRLEDYESEASIDIEEVASPSLKDEEGMVKVEMMVGPKKVVSIKDEPEVICLSNKGRKTMADRQSWGLEREKDRRLRPLRSILKVGSSSHLGNASVGDMHSER